MAEQFISVPSETASTILSLAYTNVCLLNIDDVTAFNRKLQRFTRPCMDFDFKLLAVTKKT